MRIAVLSGKGGTGKTFVSVNLASCAPSAVYMDCDVEEPNGHLFFQPVHVTSENVYKTLPVFNEDKCTGCRQCVDFCRFNALAFIGKKPKVFTDVCHSCGGCSLVCPAEAVTESCHEVGHVEIGFHNEIRVVTGMLNLGEASGVPVIKKVLSQASDEDDLVIVDCPPGSACTVMESIDSADFCVLVAEPTSFGLHNFKMVLELVRLLKKPCGVVINKALSEENPLSDFCDSENLTVLCKIPYKEQTAYNGAKARIASECDDELKEVFEGLLAKIEKEVKRI